MSAKWKKAKEIFIEALQLKPEERPQFLNKICINDIEIHREVESLLECFDNAEDFMQKPAIARQEN